MTLLASGLAERLARLALAAISLLVFTSCGSGGVSGPAPVTDPTRITVLPGSAIAFSGQPTTFVISGGTGSYIVSSSNQAVIPISGSITGGSLTIVPNAVVAETTVTLTVRDTGTTPLQSATITVRPGTVANEITITPSSTQAAACAPALCSGGDAEVTATLSQGGIALAGRAVRFEVVSGDFLFITSSPGVGIETLDTSTTVLTDETGKARARIRALASAPNQTALLQVTDTSSGSFQRTSFVIAQSTGTSPGYFVVPDTLAFQGPNADQCATTSVNANFHIFGGTPPYTVLNSSSAFTVSQDVNAPNGSAFFVTPLGVCVADPGVPITVRDAAGRTVSVTVTNVPGTQAVSALVVAPDTVTLSSCSSQASFTAAGGTGNYVASSGSSNLIIAKRGTTFTISRAIPSPATPSPVHVGITDGKSAVDVTVNLTGAGAGACGGLTTTPTAVTLTDCTSFVDVTVSGGSGTYTAASDNSVGSPGTELEFAL